MSRPSFDPWFGYAFGERLDAARVRAGLTKSELARRMGVSRQTAYQWLDGTRLPSIQRLPKLCAEVDESADLLMGLDRGP